MNKEQTQENKSCLFLDKGVILLLYKDSDSSPFHAPAAASAARSFLSTCFLLAFCLLALPAWVKAGETLPIFVPEICYNGTDDDGDGLIDCADPDCAASVSAGPDQSICGNGSVLLTATGAGDTKCDEFAQGVAHSTGNVSNPTSSLLVPNDVATYMYKVTSGTYTRMVWDMGEVKPAGTRICVKAKAAATGAPSAFSAWLLTSGFPATGNYLLLASQTFTNTSVYQDFCFTLPQASRYFKLSDDSGTPFFTDAVGEDCDNNGLFTYSWSHGGGNQPSIAVSPAVTTTYTVTLTNSAGCTATDQVTVNVNPAPVVDAGTDQWICQWGGSYINATVTGGATPYTYSWDNGLPPVPNVYACPGEATVFRVTVTGSNGCSDTDSITVWVNPLPWADAGADKTICKGQTTTLTGNAGGGNGPYTYGWVSPWTSGISRNVNPIVTTDYVLVVTSADGCVSWDSVKVIVQNCPENCSNGLDDDADGLTDCADPNCGPIVDIGNVYSICLNASQTINASVSGGNAPYSYAWSTGGTGTSITVSPTSTTEYSITVTAASGCTATDDASVFVAACSEVCANGIDDDLDGLTDCADPDCYQLSAPQLTDDAYTSCPGTVFTERVTYNDGNLLNPTFNIAVQPSSGSVTIDGTGRFTFTPFNSNCGVQTFTYLVCNAVTGCCDNATVTLTLGDSTPPSLQNVPADLTVNCDEAIPAPPLVFGYDDCPGIFIDFEETSGLNQNNTCETYHITRTWTVSDLCGNTNLDSQIISVTDLVAPELFKVNRLANGKKMLGGHAQLVTQRWKYVPFPITFSSTPLVFAQVLTVNETSPVTVRLRHVTNQGFEMRLSEEEASADVHLPETVAWMAIEGGLSAGQFEASYLPAVTDAFVPFGFQQGYPGGPVFIAAPQTTNEADPVVVRHFNLSAAGAEVRLQEETSKAPETSHGIEKLGYLALQNGLHIKNEEGEFVAETGQLILTNSWATIPLDRAYSKPVIILGGMTSNQPDPVMARVRNVTSTSFQVRLEEWAYLDGNHTGETLGYLVMEGGLPAEGSYYCDGGEQHLQPGVNVFVMDNCDNQISLEANESNVLLPNGMKHELQFTVSDDCGNDLSITRTDTCIIAALKLKALLFGALANNGGGDLMRDNLRSGSYLPLTEPYTLTSGFAHKGGGGGETVDAPKLAVTGNKAIVDWLFVELRDPNDDKKALATHSVVLHRDGSVTTAAGDSVVVFPNLPDGDYYVLVRHRNHLSLMTEHPWNLSSEAPPMVDFTTPATTVRGGLLSGKMKGLQRTMWPGDLNGDRKVIYQGPHNDVFFLFSRVLSDVSNSSYLANYISDGYDRHDLNLDGKIIYQGPNNERAMILYHTVISHPGNTGLLANFIVSEKVP